MFLLDRIFNRLIRIDEGHQQRSVGSWERQGGTPSQTATMNTLILTMLKSQRRSHTATQNHQTGVREF
jgi:hypothetical protein